MNLNAALTIGALERGGHKTRKTRNTGTLVLKLFPIQDLAVPVDPRGHAKRNS
jgi:hypothetical protein